MEAVQELLDALVDEGVMGDVVGPLLQLRSAGQLAAQDQVGSLQIIALLGQLLDWIAAVAQDAGVAINESYAAVAQRRIVERRVVTHQAEIAPVGLDLAQVQGADGAIFDGEFVLLARAVVCYAERLPARALGLIGGDRWCWLRRIHRWDPPGVGVGQASMYTNCVSCGRVSARQLLARAEANSPHRIWLASPTGDQQPEVLKPFRPSGIESRKATDQPGDRDARRRQPGCR